MQPGSSFKDAGLLLVDLQERLAPAIPDSPRVVTLVGGLVEKARQAALPILVTEQYSRGLGHTVPELRRLLAPEEVIEKIDFAAPREAAFRTALAARGLRRCFVAGMEAHVCVLQSVLGLLSDGIAVTVIADAIASRDDLNRRVALARMARAGAELTDAAGLRAALENGESATRGALSS